MLRDEVFKKPIKKQFEFDQSVASVFDDMIARSVPFYEVCTDLITDLLAKTLKKNAKVIDLGCSTANLLLNLAQKRSDLELFGIDNSQAMIDRAKNKASAFGIKLNLSVEDILKTKFSEFDCVILNYTLQFIRPIKRTQLVHEIYKNLNQNGIFVFSEKLVHEDKVLTKNFIEIYENYKEKQGYSAYEIAQKRKALENVLIPYSQKENEQMCHEAGFLQVECIFKWANFASFIAQKGNK